MHYAIVKIMMQRLQGCQKCCKSLNACQQLTRQPAETYLGTEACPDPNFYDLFLLKCSNKIKLQKIWTVHGSIPYKIYDSSFVKWPRILKGQFKGHIWPWFQWKYVMNIQSNQTLVKWFTKPMINLWFLTYVSFCWEQSLRFYLCKGCISFYSIRKRYFPCLHLLFSHNAKAYTSSFALGKKTMLYRKWKGSIYEKYRHTSIVSKTVRSMSSVWLLFFCRWKESIRLFFLSLWLDWGSFFFSLLFLLCCCYT